MKNKVYVVFQSAYQSHYKNESAGGYIETPNVGKNGKPIVWHWQLLFDVKKDDIIFHISSRKIVAVSCVEKELFVPTEDTGKNRINCKYTILKNPINLIPLRPLIGSVCNNIKRAPFNSNGAGKEFYLSELPTGLYDLLYASTYQLYFLVILKCTQYSIQCWW